MDFSHIWWMSFKAFIRYIWKIFDLFEISFSVAITKHFFSISSCMHTLQLIFKLSSGISNGKVGFRSFNGNGSPKLHVHVNNHVLICFDCALVISFNNIFHWILGWFKIDFICIHFQVLIDICVIPDAASAQVIPFPINPCLQAHL